MPIVVLIEFIKDMFQRWFHNQYEEAVKVNMLFNPWATRQLSKRFNDAHHIVVKLINRVEFEVKNERKDRHVNLSRKMCSCCEFQIDLLPYSHAIAATSKCKCEAVEFCAVYYKTTYLLEGCVKLEDLGGKGFHQLGKVVDNGEVHNAKGTRHNRQNCHLRLQFLPQIRHHIQGSMENKVRYWSSEMVCPSKVE
ncbi:Uncharacterized protein TCM_035989 [Theobroma cacao]|uniref:Zinc finger PMZ-type domain-containing protein n=1 Tax=Theobroma cacao TaxID=3641 RepID=A0A061FJQ7_THECC|nr:Uncharacterized protein TCM_035989 [Theobroma cacao]